MKWLTTGLLAAIGFTAFAQTPGNAPASTASGHDLNDMLKNHLQYIQSGSADRVTYEVYDIAATWAAAGFMDQANYLLETYWAYKPAPADTRYIQDAFTVLWAVSGKRPAAVPFEERELRYIEQENRDATLNPHQWSATFTTRFADRPWTELSGRELHAKAVLMCYDANDPAHRASREQQAEAVQAFSKLLTRPADARAGLTQAAACAALVAAGIGQNEQAQWFINYWGKDYAAGLEINLPLTLMKDRHTATLLLNGTLDSIWGLTAATCEAGLRQTLTVLGKRMKEGPSLVYGQLSLQQLLQRLSEQAIGHYGEAYTADVQQARWLGYPPAAAAAISAAEKKLGLALPADYKSLLLLTDGFRQASATGVTFLPVDKIGLLRYMDPDMIAQWGVPFEGNDTAQAAGISRSILISAPGEPQLMLLVPPAGEDGEWQYWFFATWYPGVQKHASLRYYLEDVLMAEENRR